MSVLGYDALISKKDELFLDESYKLENFQLASYEVRAGSNELLVNGVYYKTVVGDQIDIPSHQITFLSSEEIINMPSNLMGQLILRFGYSTKGLDLLAGHVDPLFQGRLVLIVRNHSEETITILPGDPIANIIFHEVEYVELSGEEVGRFSKKFEKIPHYIIDDWKGRNQPDVYKKVNEQKIKIEEIERQIVTMNSTTQIVITGGIILIATTILSVVLQVVFASWNSSINIFSSSISQNSNDLVMKIALLSVPVITILIFMVFILQLIKTILKHKK